MCYAQVAKLYCSFALKVYLLKISTKILNSVTIFYFLLDLTFYLDFQIGLKQMYLCPTILSAREREREEA